MLVLFNISTILLLFLVRENNSAIDQALAELDAKIYEDTR